MKHISGAPLTLALRLSHSKSSVRPGKSQQGISRAPAPGQLLTRDFPSEAEKVGLSPLVECWGDQGVWII